MPHKRDADEDTDLGLSRTAVSKMGKLFSFWAAKALIGLLLWLALQFKAELQQVKDTQLEMNTRLARMEGKMNMMSKYGSSVASATKTPAPSP